MDVTLHHFCHYITVPSLHNLSALHQWRPCVRLTSSSCRGNERHKQTVTGEKKEKNPFTFFFQRRKTSNNGMDFFTWREADLMLQRQNTTAAAYFFNFLLSPLSVAASRQFLFRFSHDCGQLPAYDVVLVPPNHLLVPAWVQRHPNWSGAGGLCHSVNVSWILPGDPAEKTHFSSSECVSLSVLCFSTLRIITPGYLCLLF